MEILALALFPAALLGGSGATPSNPIPAWKVRGDHANAGLGSDVSSAGDVNGDGFADVLVAAFAHNGDQVREGRAYLHLGGPDGPAKLPSWTVDSDQAGATISAARGVGDVDGDGFDDVVVGSYFYWSDEAYDGRAWLYLGSASGLGTTPAWSIDGDGVNVNLGSSVGSGDVNGDGFADVFIGVGQYTNGQASEGQVQVFLGSPAGLATTPAWSVEGNQGFSGFGGALAAGDVNGDGFDDLVVGAWSFNAGESDEGRAILYLGSASGPEALPSWTVDGDQSNAWLGERVSTADVNGDGFDDVLVGAPGFGPGAIARGRATLYLGSAGGLALTPAWTVNGASSEMFGTVAGVGDLDGDGYDDVVVGGRSYFGGQVGEGRISTFYGSAQGLALTSAWRFEGNQRDANVGWPVARAGDVNGDGFADVITGANLFDGAYRDAGAAFVFLGKSRARIP